MIKSGYSTAMSAKEVDALCGSGPMRLVTCSNGRVVGGYGTVGLLEHVGDTDIAAFMQQVQAKRDNLALQASQQSDGNPRASLYTYTVI